MLIPHMTCVLFAIHTFKVRRVALMQRQVRTISQRIFHPPLRIHHRLGEIKRFFVEGAQFRQFLRVEKYDVDPIDLRLHTPTLV